MDESSFILQNQLHGLCVRLERASLLACDESWKGERTFPPFSSIGLILEGGGTIIVNGQELHPTRGQLYLLPAHTTQTFFTDARHPYRKYYCHFNITCHGTELFDLIRTPLCVDAQDTGAAPSLFQQMIAALLGQGLTAAVKAQQHMLDLLVYYLESCPPGQLSLVKTNFGPPLAKAISYVDANLHRMLTVQEMAKIAGYAQSHFTKLFQKNLGVTPAQFLVRKKTEYAIRELTATARPIWDIADALGFSSQFYFTNFFKKHTGMTPSEYRKVYSCSPL